MIVPTDRSVRTPTAPRCALKIYRWRLLAVFLFSVCWMACQAGPTPQTEQTTWPTWDALPIGANVLVILSDTHRRDHAAPFSQGWHQTPHLELVANRGVRFVDAMTPVPISAPAYASLFTGLGPLDHGLLNNHQDLRQDIPVLAEHLKALGYDTAAVIGNPFCSSHHGFGRGFDHVWDAVEGRGKDGALLTDEALRWLRERQQNTGRPFFLFVAYMDAHTPYVTPESPPTLLLDMDGDPWGAFVAEDAHVEHRFPVELLPGGTQTWRLTQLQADGRAATEASTTVDLYLQGLHLDDSRLELDTEGLDTVDGQPHYQRLTHRVGLELHNPTSEPIEATLRFRIYRRYGPHDTQQLYEAGVRHVDRQVGRLQAYLEKQALRESTYTVFVADHGEMLGEHNAWGHVDHLWQESLAIPLILEGPGLPSGVTYDSTFDLMDLHGLLRVLGGERPEDLSPTFPHLARQPRDMRTASTFPPEASNLRVAQRSGPLKLILDDHDRAQLFDLKGDPTESRDLLTEQRDGDVRRLLSAAQEHLKTSLQAESLDLDALDAEALDRLRALGYL